MTVRSTAEASTTHRPGTTSRKKSVLKGKTGAIRALRRLSTGRKQEIHHATSRSKTGKVFSKVRRIFTATRTVFGPFELATSFTAHSAGQKTPKDLELLQLGETYQAQPIATVLSETAQLLYNIQFSFEGKRGESPANQLDSTV